MSPNNTFTTALDTCDYLPPNDLPYEPLSQVVRGGISIGDGSQGRNIKNWLVYYENNIIKVKPENGTVEFILIEPNVETLTLAFDSAMNVVLAWTISTGAFLYYYNSSTHTYIREDYPFVTSCRVCLDKVDDFYSAFSDILFVYTLNGSVYYRLQRDRYTVPYLIQAMPGYVKKAGLTTKNRFQVTIVDLPVNKSLLTYLPSYAKEGDTLTYHLRTGLISDGTIYKYLVTPDVNVAPVANPNLVFALNGNGVDGSSVFTDTSSSNSVLTTVGIVTNSVGNKLFNPSSIYFNGSSYITTENSSKFDFSLASTDFTIEFWIKPSAAVSVLGRICGAMYNSTMHGWHLFIDTNNRLNLNGYIAGTWTGDVLLNTAPVLINKWTHVAVVKTLTGYKGYVNGVAGAQYSNVNGFEYAPACSLIVGNAGSFVTSREYPFIGYIDRFQITKGVAKYISNFDPLSTVSNMYGQCTVTNNTASFTVIPIQDAVAEPATNMVVSLFDSNYSLIIQSAAVSLTDT